MATKHGIAALVVAAGLLAAPERLWAGGDCCKPGPDGKAPSCEGCAGGDGCATETQQATGPFAKLLGLTGEWVEVQEDGSAGKELFVSFRPTGGGSALVETLFPGTPKEMATIYHRDGGDIVLTHYCAVGNQPRMRAKAPAEGDKIHFAFDGGTNIQDAAPHMHELTITFVSADRVKFEWVMFQGQKSLQTVTFEVTRKKSA